MKHLIVIFVIILSAEFTLSQDIGFNEITIAEHNNWALPQITDIDNDGDMDFITTQRSSNGRLRLWKNFENFIFITETIATNLTLGLNGKNISVEDINQDGHLDIALANSFFTNDKLMWFENNGTASFTKNVIPFSNTCQSMHTLGFDGDGDTDMVIKRGNCCVVFVENDGINNFNTTQILSSPFLADITIADIDNDGDHDIGAVFDGNEDEMRWFEKMIPIVLQHIL